MESCDLEFCLEMAGLTPAPEEKADMAPWVLEPECSPHLAAGLTGQEITFEPIGEAYRRLAARHDFVVVEGAGGILVPIEGKTTMLDLMVFLGLPVLVVARPCLGTINHTLLSLLALRDAGLEAAGVVFCETEPTVWGDIEKDNLRTIERLGSVPVVGTVPYLEGLGEAGVAPRAFHEICRGTPLDIELLIDQGN